jgi:hypothetical protein
MVGKILRLGILFPLIILALLMPFSIQAATAQGVGEEGDYSMQEEYLIEINDVGDAHITDTITYDPVWFGEYGYLFEENPNLLTRRYRADSNIGEVEDFNVDIDSGDATITVSFNTPGLVYNLEGGWTIYGYGNYTLVDESDAEVTLEASWLVTNEFSLFESMGLDEQVVIDLPEGAQDAAFDEGTGIIEYDLPYAAVGEGVLASNKTLFTIIFALIMALSLILVLYVFTRKTEEKPAAVTAGFPGGPAQQVPPMAAAPVQTQTTQPPPQAAMPEAAAEPTPRFCKKCGHPRGGAEERFCRKCGDPHTT